MKFAGTFVLSALVAVVPVLAQSSASSQTTMATMTTAALTPQQTCLANCPISDVNCKAACISVPSPNEAMANRTTECAAKCPQGDGSPAATEKFAQCVQGCISSYFYSSSGAAGAATGTAGASATGSAASRASGAAATGTAASVSGSSQTGTATGAAASASKTGAASSVQIGGPVLGLAGLFAMAFAL
ncbi:MAG: hypothetical protein M1814_000172 [Vezdaea aestivalis]|nr:MAG: hypothetical protein M1814_000172 [Vezdaea aestivalis]